jgi:PKD domain
MSPTRSFATFVVCFSLAHLVAPGAVASGGPEGCADNWSQTPAGDEAISVDCRDGKKRSTTAQVAASVDDLPFVVAEEVLFARRGCTELAPAAPAPADAGHWLCPIRPAASPTPPATGLAAIARQAGLQLIARRGTVGVLPGRTLVGLPTYFWLDGVTRRAAQHTQDGWRLRIIAQPETYTWRFGDGDELTGGPGQAQPPQTSQIRHTYRQLGVYDVAVQVAWQVTFQVNGRTLDPPGEFTTTTTTSTPLAVDELRARLTG